MRQIFILILIFTCQNPSFALGKDLSLALGKEPNQVLPEFQAAVPGYTYHFPRDDFSHDNFRFEWWYYTGNLDNGKGQPFGYQLTFFRVALEGPKPINNPSKWKVDHIYFAHMTVSDIQN